MTDFQFLENMAFYQRRYEHLHYTIIRKMNDYIRTNPIHDSAYSRKIDTFSCEIWVTSFGISILKDFNSDKYNNLARITDRYKYPPGRPCTDTNPQRYY
jgi:hypothetical protein